MIRRMYAVGLCVFLVASCGGGGGGGSDGGNQGSGCLPSGAAALQTDLSGAIAGAINVGNELACGAVQCGATCMALSFSLPHPTESGNTVTVNLTIEGLTEGGSGSDLATSVSVSTGGVNAGQWTGACTTTITDQTVDDSTGQFPIYRTTGVMTCAAPLSSLTQDDLSFGTTTFTTASVWTM